MGIFCHQKKLLFFSCKCIKCLKSAKKNTKNVKLKIIDKGIYFWVNRKAFKVESDIVNWAQIFDKYDPKNKNTDMN